MLKRGIEPQTFALLARRSNQLSYSSLHVSLSLAIKWKHLACPSTPNAASCYHRNRCDHPIWSWNGTML